MIQLHKVNGNPIVVFAEDGTSIRTAELVIIGSQAEYSMDIFPELVKSRSVHTFRCVAESKMLRETATKLVKLANFLDGK